MGEEQELRSELTRLLADLEQLNQQMDEARDHRSALAQEREELRAQRTQHRERIRAARLSGDRLEVEELERELWEIRNRIEALDAELDGVEGKIEEASEQIEELHDEIEDLQDRYEDEVEDEAGESEWNISFDELREKMEHLVHKAAGAVQDIDWNAIGNQVNRAVDSAFNGVYDAVRSVKSSVKPDSAEEKPSSRFTGSVKLTGGVYSDLSFAGSAKIMSDLACTSMRASGAVRAMGDLDCTNKAVVSGSLEVDGNLCAEDLTASGSVRVDGNVNGTSLGCSGALQIGGDCTVENFRTTGRVTIGGLLNAEKIHLRLLSEYDGCQIGAIGCGELEVQQGKTFVARFFKPNKPALTCGSIEGDKLTLVGTKAEIVRGGEIMIGAGCRIGTVEYTESCTIDPEAVVDACVKISET